MGNGEVLIGKSLLPNNSRGGGGGVSMKGGPIRSSELKGCFFGAKGPPLFWRKLLKDPGFSLVFL